MMMTYEQPPMFYLYAKPALFGQNEGFHLLKIIHFLDCFMNDELITWRFLETIRSVRLAHEPETVERPRSKQVGKEEPCGGLFLLRLLWLRLAFHLKAVAYGLPDGVYCLLINSLSCRTEDIERVDSHPAPRGHLCSCDSQAVLAEDAGDLG